jgi:pimeloyl-ACP methyl ester carboxylesterase
MNYSDYCSQGTKIQTSYIKVSSCVQLFKIHFTPKKLTNYPPVIFIPGWGSFIQGWKIVLREMSKDFEIYYLETREKGSAIHKKEQEITIENIGDDIARATALINLKDDCFIALGSSMGATAILDAIAEEKLFPSLAVLIGPNIEFNIPRFLIIILSIIPIQFYKAIRPFAKWYMKRKYIDMESDSKQYHKYSYVLDNIHFGRTRRSALSFKKYSFKDKIEKIRKRILVFSGKKDILHNYKQTLDMVKRIENATLVNLETNDRTHSKEMVDEIRAYLKKYNLFK